MGRKLMGLVVSACLLTAACSTGLSSPDDGRKDADTSSPAGVTTRDPKAEVTVVAAPSAADRALDTSRTLLTRATTVVVAPEDAVPAVEAAGRAARRLGAPLLLAGADTAAVRQEIDRLRSRNVLTVDTPAAPYESGRATVETTADGAVDAAQSVESNDEGSSDSASRPDDTVTISDGTHASLAAEVTARAAGSTVRVSDADPRTSEQASTALRSASRSKVVVLGSRMGNAADASYLVRSARSSSTLPGGGKVVFPGRRMVALYGHPGAPSLGVLGEQGVKKSIKRARKVARPYAKRSKVPVVPTFEIIATVASATKGHDGDYSHEAKVSDLRPWVRAARRHGVYVVLDLQPGRASLVKQAKRYASLLRQPNVGLALDPEWKLGPHQHPLEQIGSVDAKEVNRVSTYLARLTRRHDLPQKVLVLHQFQRQMIRHRGKVDTSSPEVAVVFHADGQGRQSEKRATWRRLHKHAPQGAFWGWKNFYDEDHPTLSPKKTYRIKPRPEFVSYQ